MKKSHSDHWWQRALRTLLRTAGYEVMNIRHAAKSDALPYDFTPEETTVYATVRPFTLTSPERVVSLIRAVRYLVNAGIPGAMVECGVWKGGSAMAMALTLQALAVQRDLFLYDVFGAMPPPGRQDGQDIYRRWANTWATENRTHYVPSLTNVTENLERTGCDLSRIRFVSGKVEDTIPAVVPDVISLLRLDTDFYESTRHELEYLYPRLSPGGVLLIDDYGSFVGCRQAVDEYFALHAIHVLFNRIDADSRLIIKPGSTPVIR